LLDFSNGWELFIIVMHSVIFNLHAKYIVLSGPFPLEELGINEESLVGLCPGKKLY